MDNNPKISVIITYHNEGSLVNKAVDSVVSQLYDQLIQIIIVDDASTIPPILSHENLEKVEIIQSKLNIRLPAARNLGVSIAKAPYITFLDADDIYLPLKLKLQFEYLDAHDDVSLVGSGGIIERGGKTNEYIPQIVRLLFNKNLPEEGVMLPEVKTAELLGVDYGFHSCGFMVRKTAFDSIDGFNVALRWGEEWDFVTRLAQGHQLAYVPGNVYKYIARENSMTTSLTPEKFESMAWIYRRNRLNIVQFNQKSKDILKKKEQQAYLLASQTFIEKGKPLNAISNGLKSLMVFPSFWGFRSTIKAIWVFIQNLIPGE